MEVEESRRRRRYRIGHGSTVGERRRKHTKKASSTKSTAGPSGDKAPDERPTTIDELRKLRVDYHTQSSEQKKKKSAMKYVHETRDAPSVRHTKKVSDSRRQKKESDIGRDRRHKKRRVVAAEDDGNYVYRQRSDERASTVVTEEDAPTRVSTNLSSRSRGHEHRSGLQRSKTSSTSSKNRGSGRPSTHKGTSPERRRSAPTERRTSHRNLEVVEEVSESAKVIRTKSLHESQPKKPSLRRSNTSATAMKSSNPPTRRSPPERSYTDSVAHDSKKAPSLFGTWFGGSSTTHVPEKKITCLTCLADDIPISKSAKLPCSHRMCHDCLRRIFKLSITDPAHMPPRCCTTDHIPLKHVDKLFDMKFKVKWNHKFQEYTTRNRIYCPSKGCGEWIKPGNIAMEHGRKVGTCKRCRTRICCLCNNRMHKSKDCPKDEATKQLIETAKQEGWQRCYNCSAMVELKEGCNHMTCRCTAEFCMICGLKWKSCDCPWFNYNAVEADRLIHMNIPQARRVYADGQGRGAMRVQEEMENRREQERLDQQMARRLQGLHVDADLPEDDDHIDIFGIGNAGNHFMNQNFVQQVRDVLTANFGQAHQAADALLNGAVTGRENPLPPGPFDHGLDPLADHPPQIRRHHSTASRAYNAAATTRASERVVPARRPTDYATEAALHHPIRDADQPRQEEDPTRQDTDTRIENWRNDVIPGVEV